MSQYTTSVNTSVSGVAMTYQLSYDLAGNLTQVSTPYFDLPEAARRLQSSNDATFDSKARNRGQLLQYAVLLALENKLIAEVIGVEQLADEIRKANKAEKTDWGMEFQSAQLGDAATWYRYCSGRSSLKVSEKVSKDFHQHLNVLFDHDTKKISKRAEAIRYLGYYGGVGGQRLLIALLPFLSTNAKQSALREFNREPNHLARRILLDELSVPDNSLFAASILEGLKPYKDEVVINAACEWFEKNEVTDETALHNFAVLLENTSRARAEPLLLQILGACKRYSSGAAARTLVKIGADQDTILTSILPALKSENVEVTEGAFAILGQLKQANLPPLTELWDIFAATTRRSPNLNIAYAMPSLIERVNTVELQSLVEAGLVDESANLRYATIIIASSLFSETRNRKLLKLTDSLIVSIFELQFSDQDKERNEAAKVINRFLPQAMYSRHIEKTIAAYEAHPHATLYRLSILRTWGELAEKYDYDDRVEHLCQEAAANQQNYNFRVAAVKVLLKSQNDEVKKLLASMRNDPHEDVRRALQEKTPPVLGGFLEGVPVNSLVELIRDDATLSSWDEMLKQERAADKVPPTIELKGQKAKSWLERMIDKYFR